MKMWEIWFDLKCLKQRLCRLLLGRSFVRGRLDRGKR